MVDTEQIGIVGVGRMGQAMTKHLIRHGYAVLAQDIEPKAIEAVRAAGAKTVQTPAEVGKACTFVIVAVGYDDEAAAVVLDKGGLLETMGPGTVIAISSTCTPEHVKMLAGRAHAKGVDMLDAPICRGQRAADDGTMLTLCGGKDSVFQRGNADLQRVLQGYRLARRHRGRPIWQGHEQLFALGERHCTHRGRPAERGQRYRSGKAPRGSADELGRIRCAKELGKRLVSVGPERTCKDRIGKMADKVGQAMPIAGAIKELVKDGRRIKLSNPPDWTGSRVK